MNRSNCEERTFSARDGVNIFYRHWPATSPAKRAVIILHRGHEHSGRVSHLASELNLPGDFAIFAWDARAHGRSEGKQDAGTTMATFTLDLDDFVRYIERHHGIPTTEIAVIGQSVGAVIAAAWVHDFAPPIRALVLASPAFKVKLYVPFARPSLALWHALYGDFFVMSYVQPSALTHDPERIASYKTDPLIKRPISARVLLGLYKMAERIIDDAQAIRVPTQLLLSGSDWVVHNKPQHEFYERLGAADKAIHTFDGFFHDTLGEKERHLPVAKAREWILRFFETPADRPPLLDADQRGYTFEEHQALRKPLPALSLKNLNFAAQRANMTTGGRLSEGIRLGLATGFDSGATLDYVYRNQPSGITPIGKAIDWVYLNAIGWRGIRIRKQHIEELLQLAMRRLREAGQKVHILDVAAGHGRYVVDAIERAERQPDTILLRDFAQENVKQGRELLRSSGLSAKALFEQGDAFDPAGLLSLDPKRTLGIVSGLYELFPSNTDVRKSLAGLAGAIAPGGYLIYTGQPWHPQLEMIARTLTSHRGGQAWVMRRRTQQELDDLVAAAGFRKVAQRIDEYGIFTVSLAQRVAAP